MVKERGEGGKTGSKVGLIGALAVPATLHLLCCTDDFARIARPLRLSPVAIRGLWRRTKVDFLLDRALVQLHPTSRTASG